LGGATLIAVDFFCTEERGHLAFRAAASEAERLLTRILSGDAEAARSYFDSRKTALCRRNWPLLIDYRHP